MSAKHDQKPPPVRYRLTVPAADVAVNEWMERQDNVSASVRAVIREYIERNGFEDPTCKPVTQQPRRGRPPVSEDSGDIDFSAMDARAAQELSDEPETPLGMALAEASGRAAQGRQQAAQAASEQHAAPNDHAGEEPESMDDIFSTGRNR